jgi:hypothetical protein
MLLRFAVRLDVAKLDLMLSSDCSQIGTGSSNSPRSATHSPSPWIFRSSRRNRVWLRHHSVVQRPGDGRLTMVRATDIAGPRAFADASRSAPPPTDLVPQSLHPANKYSLPPILSPERLPWKTQLDPSGSITLSDNPPSRTAPYTISPVSSRLRHIIVPVLHL